MTVTRVAIYCRRSRADNRKGVEDQEADALGIARAKGWHVSDDAIYVDNNLSASEFSNKARANYLRMLDDIEVGKYDAIILWMEDRGHRQVIEAADFVHLCLDHGVTQIIVTSDDRSYDLTDPLSRAEFYGKAAEAQKESAKTSRRLRRQRQRVAEQGDAHIGGYRHFGFQKWTSDGNGGVKPGNAVPMRRVLQEQQWANEAIQRVLAGDSVRGIVQDWKRRKIKTTKDGDWTNAALRKMLMSPALAGYRQHNGEIVRGEDGRPIDATWLPIVDRADWEMVRAILGDPARTTTRGRGPAYLLTGIVYCGVCGRRMRALARGQTSKPIYRCENYDPGAPVPRPSRLVSAVDREVERRLFLRVERSERFKDAASHSADDDPSKPIYNELARLTAKLDRVGDDEIARLAEDEELDDATRRALLKAAERKRAKIEREMDGLRAKLDGLDGARVRVHIPDNLPDVWEDLTLDRRRGILKAMVDFVIILPAELHGPVSDLTSIVTIWKGWRQWPDGVPLIDPVRARLEGS